MEPNSYQRDRAPPAGGRLAYTIDELAVSAGCGRDKIYDEIRKKRLVARKLGRRTLVLDDDARAFLNGLPTLQLLPAE